MVKRFFSILLAGTIIFSLSACGKTSEESEKEAVTNIPIEENTKEETGKTLVVYYSATGSTKAVANYIADAIGADLFELEPVEPYTDEDLAGSNDDSRVSREHNDESLRDVDLVSTTVDNFSDYDEILIGYPKMEYSL